MGRWGMRATGGTRGAGGEAFGPGHLQRCLGSRDGLPSSAPRGGLRDPLASERRRPQGEAAAAPGVGGAGGAEIFFSLRRFWSTAGYAVPGTHRPGAGYALTRCRAYAPKPLPDPWAAEGERPGQRPRPRPGLDRTGQHRRGQDWVGRDLTLATTGRIGPRPGGSSSRQPGPRCRVRRKRCRVRGAGYAVGGAGYAVPGTRLEGRRARPGLGAPTLTLDRSTAGYAEEVPGTQGEVCGCVCRVRSGRCRVRS